MQNNILIKEFYIYNLSLSIANVVYLNVLLPRGPDVKTYRQIIGTSIQHQDSLAKQYARFELINIS